MIDIDCWELVGFPNFLVLNFEFNVFQSLKFNSKH